MEIAEGRADGWHEVRPLHVAGKVVLGGCNEGGKEVDQRERRQHEHQCRFRREALRLSRREAGDGGKARGGHRYEEDLGAAEDAVGVAVPEAGKEGAQRVARIHASAGGVYEQHVGAGQREPRPAAARQRHDADNTDGGEDPLRRLLGVERERRCGIEALGPGEVQVAGVVVENHLLKRRGIEHELPDGVAQHRAG